MSDSGRTMSAFELQPDDLQAWLRLALTPGVGNATARRLLSAYGLPGQVFQQTRAMLQMHVTAAQAGALLREPKGFAEALERTCQWLQSQPSPAAAAAASGPASTATKPDAVRTILVLGDPRYPRLLLETEDPPLMLYVLGAARFLQPDSTPFPEHTCLAVVGSRNPSAQGTQNALQFAQALRGAGLSIVSRLALGIDAAAHAGALQDADTCGEHRATPATIAVVGTGLDRVYPRRHLALAHHIAMHGLLVSEYPLGTPPLPANFPKRNRIIAGLSQGTLVVEAAPASGSLITARLANEQGREVFAIPGSIHAPQSRGCHALIRQGAKLVESVQDVLEELHLPASTALTSLRAPSSAAPKEARRPAPPRAPLPCPAIETPASPGPKESPLLQALGYDPSGLDALQARTGLDTAVLQVQLLELELDGQVARLPGGLFQRIGSA